MRRWMIVCVGVVAAGLLAGCGMIIEDGQAGVSGVLGHIADQPLDSGWHWYLPGFSWVEPWDVKTQELKESASVPSSEGLISSLDVSVLYNVSKEQVVHVRKTIGAWYGNTVVEPYVREAIRNTVSGYPVKALFSDEGRKEIGERMLAFLRSKLAPRGITVQDVLLRDVKLPPTFAASIEAKLKAEQESFQKEFELTKAKKDAEIEVARAEGAAKSNQIIAGSLSESYIRYLWIQGLKMSEMQVVYVPTEANIPIMEAGRWAVPKPEKK